MIMMTELKNKLCLKECDFLIDLLMTDRTNQITRVNKKIFTILSGKWNTAASLSQKILREIIDE